MSGAQTTSKCKSKCSFCFEMQFLFCAFICSLAVIAQFCVQDWNRHLIHIYRLVVLTS
jgi:hypothetical protein